MHVFLKGIQIYAYHGVLPQENKVGSYFYIDMNIKTDFSSASKNDSLEGTINYADLYLCVKEEMKIPSKLLEHVAERIAKRIFHEFAKIEEIEIKISKENPPMGAQTERVGIAVHYTRSSNNNR